MMKRTSKLVLSIALPVALLAATAQPAIAASKKTELLISADAGFVYKTDALTSKKVKVALRIIPGVHKPILYPAGIVKDTKHLKEAADFYTYLQGSKADAIFVKYGFMLP